MCERSCTPIFLGFENKEKMARRILCIGASLTEGFCGCTIHPYTNKLSSLLSRHGDFEIINSGRSGETIEMIAQRLGKMLTKQNYEFIIIQGGSNNLFSTDGDTIGRYVKKALDIGLQSDARKIGYINIPEMEFDGSLFENTKRLRVNEQVKNYIDGNERLFLVDFSSKIPNTWKNSYFLQAPNDCLWSDNIHLNPSGYDKLGEVVYEQLIKYIQP